jgi:hypothetical protein
MAHDLGLAASIGGGLFGKTALDPALKEIEDPAQRDRVNRTAWRRYGWISLAAHVATAAPWFAGRAMLSGREVSPTARRLTRTKDVLMAVSLATCAVNAILGGRMAKRAETEPGPEEARAQRSNGAADGEAREKLALDRAIDVSSMINLAANIGVVGVTAALAMEGSESVRFALRSRRLP